MRKILLPIMLCMWVAFLGACKRQAPCHISGTVPARFEGKRIFLVPLNDDRAEVVDSVVIRDGKFEFTSDTLMMAKILIDYHFRQGVQPLLVVVEPGEVAVVIDSISQATGTPLNDSLEQWKNRKMEHDWQGQLYGRYYADLKVGGNEKAAEEMKQEADSFHLAFKNYSRRLAANVKGTVLGDFLAGLYPRTYKKMMPDSTMVEFDADTHEPIAK